jgi:Zn-dependent alcohol dehydrogenase
VLPEGTSRLSLAGKPVYLAGKLRLDDLISRRYSMDEANEGFRDLASGALARGLIVF